MTLPTHHRKLIQLRRWMGYVLFAVISLNICISPLVSAAKIDYTEDQLRSLGIYFIDQGITGTRTRCSPSSSNASPSTPTANGSVYVVGDSIGTQFAPKLESALNSSGSTGWSVPQTTTPNVLASRQLSGGPSPDGLATIDADQAFIKTASTVIIELGTNSGGLTATNITSMINKIKQFASPSTRIFWVNTATSGTPNPSLPIALGNVNGIIASQAPILGYQVISWNNKVFGAQADPTNINPSAPDNGYIRHSDQYVHLTDAGITAMNSLIASTLTGESSSNTPATGSSCACSTSSSSTTLTGSSNGEKIWNFLVGKGLTPPQAAGVMGNLQAESGENFDPAADQGGPGGVDGASGNAYGIAQWDGGRRLALEAAAKAQGVAVSDLAFQLNYLYTESQGRTQRDNPSVGEWDGLTQINDSNAGSLGAAGAAAYYWHYNFERSGDRIDQILGNRVAYARDILAKYGSGTPGSGGNPGSNGCSGSVSGKVGAVVQDALLYSWPESHGMEAKPEYAAAVASIFPNAPYGGADCGSFVGIVMHASKADLNYPLSGTPGQEAYVRAHPELYDVVDSVANVSDLRPGDILIVNGSKGGGGRDGHTYIFVGNQPNGKNAASASGGDRMANLVNAITHDDRGNYLRARLK